MHTWFWHKGASQPSSPLLPTEPKVPAWEKAPIFIYFRVNFIFKLICGLLLLLAIAKFVCVKSAGNLFYLHYSNQKIVCFFLYARKIMSDTDMQRKHWSTKYCHWQSKERNWAAASIWGDPVEGALLQRTHALNFRDAMIFHVGQRQKRNVPPVSCERNSLKFVFVLHLGGR